MFCFSYQIHTEHECEDHICSAVLVEFHYTAV